MGPGWGAIHPSSRGATGDDPMAREGRGGETDTVPADAGKRRSFSLTLVSLVASPLAIGTEGCRVREADR